MLALKFKNFRIRNYKAWVVLIEEEEKTEGVEREIKENLIKEQITDKRGKQ